MSYLGNKLKTERQKRNLTQSDMAELLNLKRSTYSLYEGGQREPNIETLQRIATVFDITVDELVGWDKNKPIQENLKNSSTAASLTMDAMISGAQKAIARKAGKSIEELSCEDVENFLCSYSKQLSHEEKLRLIKLLSE